MQLNPRHIYSPKNTKFRFKKRKEAIIVKTENNENIRCCDEVGRVMIPYKLREKLNIEEKDSLKMEIRDGKLIIKKA
jgi:AbrB family looped-hinge helix DNA binding protein